MNSKTVLTAAIAVIAGLGLAMGPVAFAQHNGTMGNQQGAGMMGQGAGMMGQGAGMMGQAPQRIANPSDMRGTMHGQTARQDTRGTMHGQTARQDTHGTMHDQTVQQDTRGTMHGQTARQKNLPAPMHQLGTSQYTGNDSCRTADMVGKSIGKNETKT